MYKNINKVFLSLPFSFFKLCWYLFSRTVLLQMLLKIIFIYACNENCWIFSKQAMTRKSRVRSLTSAPNYSWFCCFRNLSRFVPSYDWATDAGIKNIPDHKKRVPIPVLVGLHLQTWRRDQIKHLESAVIKAEINNRGFKTVVNHWVIFIRWPVLVDRHVNLYQTKDLTTSLPVPSRLSAGCSSL